jgi:hypothetical protein
MPAKVSSSILLQIEAGIRGRVGVRTFVVMIVMLLHLYGVSYAR